MRSEVVQLDEVHSRVANDTLAEGSRNSAFLYKIAYREREWSSLMGVQSSGQGRFHAFNTFLKGNGHQGLFVLGKGHPMRKFQL